MNAIKGRLAYFSHSIKHYDTEEERNLYVYLNQIFEGFIICPRQHLGELSNPKDYARIARNTDCVFVMPVTSGSNQISTGCFSEIVAALKNNKQVFFAVQFDESFTLKKVTDVVQSNGGKPIRYTCVLS